MSFNIYNVVDNETERVIKIGSTIQTLKRRFRQVPYNQPSYQNRHLVLRRSFECDDRDFGILLLRVREQFEISRARLWLDQGGLNAASPVETWLRGVEGAVQGKIGGRVRMMRPDAKEHIKRISALGAKASKESPKAHQIRVTNAKILGAKNRDSGHMRMLGLKYGPTQGAQNFQKWNFSSENHEHLKTLRTPEHQRSAAKKAAKIAKDSGQIAELGKRMGLTVGAANFRAWREKEALTGFARLRKILTPEHQQKAAWANAHKRYHVNIKNPKCPHCQKGEIA